MLKQLRQRAGLKARVAALHLAVVERSRAPVFFEGLGVADTIDGRFDLLSMHAFLLLRQLQANGETKLAQGLTDALFVGIDEALRDLGAGDIGIGKRVRKFADAFYGRMNAYGAAQSAEQLAGALERNLFRSEAPARPEAQQLAEYMLTAQSRLAASDFHTGPIDFGPLPACKGS